MADAQTPPVADEPNYLTADDIFKLDDTVYKDVIIPEWTKNGKPGVITLRSFNAKEAVDFTDKEEKLKVSGAVALVHRMAWDRKNNRPAFTEAQVAMLETRSNKVFIRLQREAMALNGWRTPEERAAALEAAKNASAEAN